MKVFAVSHACVTDVNQQLYVELSKIDNNEVTLCVPENWRSEYSTEVIHPGILPAVDFPVKSLPVHLPGNINLHFYKSGAGKLLDNAKPDVMFIDEEPWSLATAQWLRLCRQRHIPAVVYTMQNIYKQYPFPFNLLEQRCYKTARAIPVLNDEARSVLKRKGFQGDAPYLPLGCDLTLFHYDRTKRATIPGLNGVVLGYMGRLVPDKGVDTLIEAAAILHSRDPHLDFSVLIVGAGTEEERLKSLANSKLKSGTAIFTGSVPHNQAGDYMRAMDVFVLCSRTRPNWKEQFGRVIVEAMATGAPVVGSNSGEIPVLINLTGGGMVFEEGNASSLADCLLPLVRESSRRAELGEIGKQCVRSRFTHAAVAQTLNGILHEAVASASSGRG